MKPAQLSQILVNNNIIYRITISNTAITWRRIKTKYWLKKMKKIPDNVRSHFVLHHNPEIIRQYKLFIKNHGYGPAQKMTLSFFFFFLFGGCYFWKFDYLKINENRALVLHLYLLKRKQENNDFIIRKTCH